jgi:hypothetical protein
MSFDLDPPRAGGETMHASESVQIVRGDAIDVLTKVPAGTFDAVVTDPPHEILEVAWDVMPPIELWKQLLRVFRPGAVLIAIAAARTFADRLQEVIESDIIDRARTAVLTAMGISAPKKPGRPPKAVKLSAAKVSVVVTKRKKPSFQLCPVPGCKNAAAPVFGMVCAKHRDLPKATIKRYREARKAKKLKAEGNAPAKARATKVKRKPAKAVRTAPTKNVKARRSKVARVGAKKTPSPTSAPMETTAPTSQVI